MADMPAYVKHLAYNFDKDRDTTSMRTAMDDGFTKQSRFKARAMIERSFLLEIPTYAEYLTFITWFNDTINMGNDWFNWVDPEDSATKLVRIKNGKLGKEMPIHGTDKWRIPVVLEMWSTN